MTDAETMYRLHNPYQCGVDSIGLCFAHKTLREAREALERGVGFRGDVAPEVMAEILREADAIRRLISKKEAA